MRRREVAADRFAFMFHRLEGMIRFEEWTWGVGVNPFCTVGDVCRERKGD